MAATRINLRNTTDKNVYVEDIGYERRIVWKSGATLSILENDIDLSYSVQKLLAVGVLAIVE